MQILIQEYDATWPRSFELEAERLREALAEVALRIDHVGSTAVPGLAAKPVIDIQISVAQVEPEDAYRLPLVSLGYTYASVPFPYFHRPEGWPHTHHLHVRLADSPEEQRILAFRDWLREHEADCRAYESLKRALAGDAQADSAAGRFRYSEAKTEFVRAIERRAQSGETG